MNLKASEIQLLSARYAKALFQAVEGKGKGGDLSKVSKELDQILGLSGENESFSKLLTSPVFSKSDKADAVKEISKKLKFSEKVSNLLLVLAENNRLEILPQICVEFEKISMESKGVVKAQVTSAKKLSAKQIKDISSSISESTGKEVQCETIIDESIIGGLKIKIGSKLIDNSIAGRLERLKLKLTS